MLTLPPVAVTGAAQSVQLPIRLPAGGQVQIANESPYYFQVGFGAQQRWLAAWTIDVIELPVGVETQLTFTPTLIGTVVNAPSQSLVITMAEAGEKFSGNYPAAVSRQISIAAGIVTITAGTVNIAGNLGSNLPQTDLGRFGPNNTYTNVAIPTGTHALAIDLEGEPLSAFTRITITGHRTGITYYETFLPVAQIAVFPFLSAQDTAVDIQIVGTVQSLLNLTALLTSVPEWQGYYRAPWQSPNQPALAFDTGNIAVGGNLDILGPIPNITYYLFSMEVIVFLANFSQTFKSAWFVDGGFPANPLWWNLSNQPVPPNNPQIEYFDFKGIALTKGNAFRVLNKDPAQTCRAMGTVTWSKG